MFCWPPHTQISIRSAPAINTMMEEKIVALSEESIEAESRERWMQLRQKRRLCDAVLHTEDGGTFPVHRCIMAQSSQYFQILFTTSLSFNCIKKSFLIPGISLQVMDSIVEYAYAGMISTLEGNVLDVLVATDYLSVLGLLKDCCDSLLLSMEVTNCIGLREFAKTFFCVELEKSADRFLMTHFVQVSNESEEFLEMPPEEVLQLLSSDYINVTKEEQVWEAGVKWIDYCPGDRGARVADVMRAVRLGLLDNSYFREKVRRNRYVQIEESCAPIIMETMSFLWDLEEIMKRTEAFETPFLATPRIPHSILFAVGGWSSGSSTNLIEAYDTKADRWIQVAQTDPTGPRGYHKLAVIGFNIYVIGGFDGNEYFNSSRCFDAVSKQWKDISPMHVKRCFLSVIKLNNLIYAIGGFDGRGRLNTVERYDYHTNQWTFVAPMDSRRSDASAATLNGLIYVVGGFTGADCLPTCEYYDPAADCWTPVASMHHRRSGVSAISHGGFLYAIGGFNGISRLASGERYDPGADRWTPIPDMFSPRSNFAVEVIDDMILVIGGFNGVNTISYVECFDPQTNKWYECTDMHTRRSALAACVVPGLPNIADYVHQNRRGLMEETRQKLLQQMNAEMERAQVRAVIQRQFVFQHDDNEEQQFE